MISHCPQCETILKNPKHCACGWTLEEISLEAAKTKAINLRSFVESLNHPYEPGSDYGVEHES